MESTDIWFIAFLKYKGYKIKDFKKLQRGRVSCKFDIQQQEWDLLKLEFDNSEFVKFKALVEQVKDLGF